MSSLFKSSTPKVIPEFTGLQVNTAVQVLAIPVVYGSPRVAINLIYYNGFNVKQVNVGGGGKGILGGGKGGSKEVEYFATIILAICEGGSGGIGAIQAIYQDQGVYTTGDYPSPGLNIFNGGPSQTPWSYVASTWPSDARPYPGLAYIAVANAELDSSATVPQINIVIQGILTETCPLNDSTITITTGQYDQNGNPISFLGNIHLGYADADPALVIYDILTDPVHGATFPAALIDSAPGASLFSGPNATDLSVGDAALQTYCQAVGLGYSLSLDNVESTNSILDRLTRNMTVAPVWTGELLKFIPYWDSPTDLNPGWNADNPSAIPLKAFAPNTTPIAQITLDHILQAKEKDKDPITFSRVDPMTVYNTVRVDFKDRTNFFNDNVVEAKDEANAELFGPRIDNIGLADEFTLAVYANVAAQTRLRRNIQVRRQFTWRMGPLWAWLDPMDLVQIPDPTNWGVFIAVRIISAEDDEEEITTYVAEEFTGGAASPTFIPTSPTTPPNQGATNVPPSPVFPPVIFEPTTALLTAQGIATSTPQVITGTSGGTGGILDPNWGGCIVWVSLDNVNYTQLSPPLIGPSAIGVLSAPLPPYGGSNPDNTDTLSVNMSESGIALPSFSPSVAGAGGTSNLAIIQGSGTF